MKRKFYTFILYTFLVFLAIICIIPFFIMILNATQSSSDLLGRINWAPGKYMIQNYKTMVSMIPFWTYVKNSLIVSVASILITGYFGTMAAYGFEKFNFKGRDALFAVAMLMMVIPGQISLIGLYRIYGSLGLLNTLWTLILPSVGNVLTVYWMRSNIYQVIDDSLLEAAVIDGCSEIKIFHLIVLPICRTGLVTISIMNFVSCWNNYIDPVTFITSTKKTTISVGIAILNSMQPIDYGAVYLATALGTGVILLFYTIFSAQIIGGVTEGSVKG